jgi:signal transduction histidine kinase/CheY-like chemotaxis protein/HPt (histidine-containing phosphotransfer) domain-containing protein
LESELKAYSYEELSSGEGAELKRTFESFKTCIEDKLFNPTSRRGHKALNSNDGNGVLLKKKISKQKAAPNATKLIARVSHEIRTPLNGIIGFSDLLMEDRLTENQLKKVEAIHNASDALMEIVNELLEYAKLSEGLEVIEHIDFNFQSVLDNVEYLCKTLITKKEIALKLEVEPGIPNILKGDPSKLSQILLNLLGNSIKFVEKGEIKLSIKQKSQRNKNLILAFKVSDTGIGIAQEHLGDIFDSFKQVGDDTFTKYGGSGLGLNIVKQIIELLGGNITVSSELGKGTTFNFEIPYEKGDQNNVVKRSIDAKALNKAAQMAKGMRIVVFEDNTMNQRVIEQRLKNWGSKVFITDNGQKGIDYIAENKVDLVLMDLRMPGMDGYTITKKIRNHSNKNINSIPVIAITADITISEKENGKAIGLNDFILKPFNPEELLLKIVNLGKKEANSIPNVLPKTKTMQTTDRSTPKASLSTMQEECMGDHGFLTELVRLFKQNILEFIGAYSVHMKNADWESIAFAAHKIKASVSLVEANALLDIVQTIEALAKTNPTSNTLELGNLHKSFIKEFKLVENVIDKELETLGKKK